MKAKRRSSVSRSRVFHPKRDGITQTMLTYFLTCREKAALYAKRLTPIRRREALDAGTIWHIALEMLYAAERAPDMTRFLCAVDREFFKHVDRGRVSAEEQQAIEKQFALLGAVLPGYLEFWGGDPEINWVAQEQEFDINAGAFRIRGKIDGLFRQKNDDLWLFETKTMGRVDEGGLADALPMNLQLHFYAYAASLLHGCRPRGVLYNVIRRPQLEQRKGTPAETPEHFEARIAKFKRAETQAKHREAGPNPGRPAETLQQFADRVAQDVAERPEWYFFRWELPITDDDFTRATDDLVKMLHDFTEWHANVARHYRNGSACLYPWTCMYLPVCAQHNADGFHIREHMYPELV